MYNCANRRSSRSNQESDLQSPCRLASTAAEMQPPTTDGHGPDVDKLFTQLLDDVDNISGASQSVRPRKRAIEIFSDWLFSSRDVRNPQISRVISEQQPSRRLSGDFTGYDLKKQIRQQSCDVEPFRREQSSRRSYGGANDLSVQRRAMIRKARPSSFHYPSEDEDDSGYYTGNSTVILSSIKKRPASASVHKSEKTQILRNLKFRIEQFNRNNHGLFMEMTNDASSTFQGFIRVHMNVSCPINMSISAQPASLCDVLKEKSTLEDLGDAQITTSFCLPKNTTKVIHISSTDTTQVVIKSLLAKFSITDNPQKFVLFERNDSPNKKVAMRQMRDDEMPLPICLSWTDEGIDNLDNSKFVLQENDAGEIMWQSFNLVELESFLNVINREEDEHIDQVKTKYRKLKVEMEKLLQIKQWGTFREEKRNPAFV